MRKQASPQLFKQKGTTASFARYLPLLRMLLVVVGASLAWYSYGGGVHANARPDTKMIAGTSSAVRVDEISWCDRVQRARAGLDPALAVDYPCAGLQPATSAVVCMLTDAVTPTQANKILFTGRDYVNGALALGVTLTEHTDPSTTHLLLLVSPGFNLPPDDADRLRRVGWTLGVAPTFALLPRYVPTYPRYKTTYAKVTAIGLDEYDCVLLLDADTLAVGDLRELLTCAALFARPEHRLAATLDLDRGRWYGVNTGSVLWRTDARELERLYQLSRDSAFMRRFSSDQEFLNHVYPERFNVTRNNHMMMSTTTGVEKDTNDGAHTAEGAQVADLTWNYNAQTHVEAEMISWWEERRPDVRILHFTRKKGWQCEERYGPPPPLEDMPTTCHLEKGGLRGGTQPPICYCREAHLYWNALQRANSLLEQTTHPRLTLRK